MVRLELLDQNNESSLREVKRDDIPVIFAEDVSKTIELARYGEEKGLRGHCYAIRHDGEYVGVILVGEAIEDEADPAELRGTGYFRIIGLVLGREHRSQGVGSQALRAALDEIYREYGRVPILLECHRENVRAMAFYTKMGFRNTGILHMDDFYFVKY